MDCESDWMSCKEEFPSTSWKELPQYPPICYSGSKNHGNFYPSIENEPLYTSGRDPYSFQNFWYNTSPRYSETIPYMPDTFVPTELNRMKYTPYLRHQTAVRNKDSMEHNSCNKNYNDPLRNAEVGLRNYYYQVSQHQKMKTLMPTYDGRIIKMRQTMKKKSKLCGLKNKNDNSINFSLDSTIIPNFVKSKSDSKCLQNFNSSFSNNRQSSLPGVSELAIDNDVFKNNTKPENVPSYFPPHTEEKYHKVPMENFQHSSYHDSHFKICDLSFEKDSTAPNSTITISSTSEDKITNRELDTDISKVNLPNNEAKNNATSEICPEFSNALVLGNTNSEIHSSGLDNIGDGTENITFQPIFEGKDQNGEDFIVLFAASSSQQDNSTNTTPNTDNIQLISSLDAAENLANDKDLTSNKCDMLCSQNKHHFFVSNINDFVSEEIIETCEIKCPSNKRKKEDQLVKDKEKNETQRKKCVASKSVSETNFSKTKCQAIAKKIFKKSKFSKPALFKNRRHHKVIFHQNKLKYRRQFDWKSTKPLKRFKVLYFAKMMRCLRCNNEHIKQDALWEVMKIILNKIGSNVMQSIYDTIQKIINNHFPKKDIKKSERSNFKNSKKLYKKCVT